jgi:signal transduction histidine kinase
LNKAAVRPSDLAASPSTSVHASPDAQPVTATEHPYEPLILVLICALMALVFVFDIATPHDDVSVPFLYAIPIFVTVFSRRWSPYPFAVATTILSAVGAFILTPGETLDLVFFTNRMIAVAAQWLVAFLVTTRKDAEALMRAEFEAEKNKVETSRRFMDVLSHEIGTSLTMIDGQAFRLRKLAESNEPMDAVVRAEKIRQAVRDIETVVRQVQLASEVGEGSVYFRSVSVPLAALVTDAVLQVESARPIHTELTELPEIIWGDSYMLRQVIANLLSNALKYSPPGSPVEVRGWTGQDLALLSFTDHGRGIPEDEKAQLSEPYYRARNAHGVHGTGIGLYITKRFIASHGGSLDIDSKLGVGTTVTIRIPVGQPPSDDSRDSTAHSLH